MGLTKQQAIKEHRIMWDWLSKNPDKEKNDYMQMYRTSNPTITLESVFNNCFMCEYTLLRQQHSTPLQCKPYCPVKWPDDKVCESGGDLYTKWCYTPSSEYRVKFAEQIRDLPEREDIV